MITLDMITRFGGTDGMLINENKTDFESVGVMQRLKIFFNIGDARKRNASTVSEISTAVFNDPRFQSTDLQNHAKRLLAGVRTDRAIDATRIKGIVQELEGLAQVNKPNIVKRVDLHMAAGKLPANLHGCADQVVFVAKHHANTVATAEWGNALAAGNPNADYIPVDLARSIGEATTKCQAVLDAVSNVPDANTRDLVDFVDKHLDQLVFKYDTVRRPIELRTSEEIADIGKFCGQASRAAHIWMREDYPRGIVYDEPELVKPYEMAAVEFLAAVGKPVPPSLYGTIDQMVRGFLTDPTLVSSFSAAVKAKDHSIGNLKNLLAGDVAKIYSAIKGHAGFRAFCTDALGTDVKAFEAFGCYVAKLVALRLSAGVKDAIRRELLVQFGSVNSADIEEQLVQPVGVAFETAVRDAIMNDLY